MNLYVTKRLAMLTHSLTTSDTAIGVSRSHVLSSCHRTQPSSADYVNNAVRRPTQLLEQPKQQWNHHTTLTRAPPPAPYVRRPGASPVVDRPTDRQKTLQQRGRRTQAASRRRRRRRTRRPRFDPVQTNLAFAAASATTARQDSCVRTENYNVYRSLASARFDTTGTVTS